MTEIEPHAPMRQYRGHRFPDPETMTTRIAYRITTGDARMTRNSPYPDVRPG